MAFSPQGEVLDHHQIEFKQHYPKPGWVEHDAEDIWQTAVDTVRTVVARQREVGRAPKALGITNQRETVVIWDRKSGQPVHNAIVWQDRRTAGTCGKLKEAGHEPMVQEKTGLLLDPYFSATKITWLLDSDPDLRVRAEKGELAAGTIECFLLWRLTGGRVHASDATNASRTMLFDYHTQDWSDELLELHRVPRQILPEVVDNAGYFGDTDAELFGQPIPICGLMGDQQSAAIGQGCIAAGSLKSTYGTGCFLLQNTGPNIVVSKNKLLSTMAYRVGNRLSYAVEGSIFMAGAAVKWLRDGLELIEDTAETEAMAASLQDNAGVYLVPAFTGLGAPHWDADARGAIYGLTQDTGPATIARATLESVAYQTHDLVSAAQADGAERPEFLRVDGGMVANNWFTQFLADLLGAPVDRPKNIETTAMGAAFLAGLGSGLYEKLEDVEKFWSLERRFEPTMDQAKRQAHIEGWRWAVERTLSKGRS
jgi:glycerol kinase